MSLPAQIIAKDFLNLRALCNVACPFSLTSSPTGLGCFCLNGRKHTRQALTSGHLPCFPLCPQCSSFWFLPDLLPLSLWSLLNRHFVRKPFHDHTLPPIKKIEPSSSSHVLFFMAHITIWHAICIFLPIMKMSWKQEFCPLSGLNNFQHKVSTQQKFGSWVKE